MRLSMLPIFTPPPQTRMTSPYFTGHAGKRRMVHGSALAWRGSVKRALPYPESEKRCRWVRRDTPSGRRILVLA